MIETSGSVTIPASGVFLRAWLLTGLDNHQYIDSKLRCP